MSLTNCPSNGEGTSSTAPSSSPDNGASSPSKRSLSISFMRQNCVHSMNFGRPCGFNLSYIRIGSPSGVNSSTGRSPPCVTRSPLKAEHSFATSDSSFLSSIRKLRKADFARKSPAPAMEISSLGKLRASSTKQSEQKAITPPDIGIHPDSWRVPGDIGNPHGLNFGTLCDQKRRCFQGDV